MRLYGSAFVVAAGGCAGEYIAGIGQVADELPDRVAGQREVGLEDPCVLAGLAVHAASEAHDSRPVRARRVGDVRLAVRAGAEVMNQTQVRPLDRLDQLTGRLDQHCRRQRPIELPVGVRVAGAALDEQMAGALREERPQCWQPVGPVDVDPQEAGLADRVLVAPRLGPNGRGEEHLLAGVGVPRGERQQWPQPVTSARLSAA